ncbi:hypothetical protein H6G26_34890 [Nostoc sp. FACHB-888]|nr:hypothetical protein [Nostoc sp. FACHB-888]
MYLQLNHYQPIAHHRPTLVSKVNPDLPLPHSIGYEQLCCAQTAQSLAWGGGGLWSRFTVVIQRYE